MGFIYITPIHKTVCATGALPEDFADLLSMNIIEVNGEHRAIIDFA